MSRYSNYSDRAYRRQYDQPFNFTAFNAATITQAIPEQREQIAAIDASFIDKSGKSTWGLDWFYNGSSGKAQKGLEISVMAVVDVQAHQGYTLSVSQTIARPSQRQNVKGKARSKPEEISERMQGYIAQVQNTRPLLPKEVKYLAADGFYSKKSFVDALCALQLHIVSKLRIDAAVRYLYQGDYQGRGAPRKYAGKFNPQDLDKLDFVCELEPNIELYTKDVWHVSLKRPIRMACIVNRSHTSKVGVVLLFTTDIQLDPLKIYLYYKARFHIEFIFRDAKQFTGLCDCQSRQKQRLLFHFNASLTALNLAKLEMSPSIVDDSNHVPVLSFSMGSHQRREQNCYFMEVFISMLDLDQTLIKSHPNYEKCLRHGSLSF
jgi:hypothetical protein